MNLDTARLRDVAYRKRITQTELSRLTGITRTTTNAVFCGRSCSEETAKKIATVLGVPLQDIVARGER